MDSTVKYRRRIGCWRCTAILAILTALVLLIGLIVGVTMVHRQGFLDNDTSMPCPERAGGLMTSGDPQDPSPFHDLTLDELRRLYTFLRGQSKLKLVDPDQAAVNTSYIFMVDLLMPPKQRVLSFLDDKGQQPAREARVMVFRGDKSPPLVEEYRVGPLSEPTYAELIVNSQRRNPVPFAFRPLGVLEFKIMLRQLLSLTDQKVGHILTESYGAKFTDCGDRCLTFYTTPVGTRLIGSITREIWLWANYDFEYYTLHPLDFAVLTNVNSSDPSKWTVSHVWYSGTLYQSLTDLAEKYASGSPINKTRVPFPTNSPDMFSTQRLRGDPAPDPPQRPPLQTEPDGKRYSIHHRHVNYLHWSFDMRLSAFTGPQVHDVRYQGERIAYELSLSDIAVFYSGYSPMQRTTDFVDTGALMGTHSKSLIPGVDCPEGATFLNVSFLGEGMGEATTLAHAQCVFEQNTGIPLRRHLSYAVDEGGFFGGMVDSVLVVRSILTVGNYDYIVDFVFHQGGAIECRAISTGYILATFYSADEAPYGFRLEDNMNGNVHHHMFHFKADLDIAGTSNRYETLDISQDQVTLRQMGPAETYYQTKFDRNPRTTETDAVYLFDFDHPKYHVVHNDKKKTKHGVPRAFRLHMAGMSKQLLPADHGNEASISWARQQLAVTVHKDDELVSSSPYGMFDSYDPVTSFSDFIDGENIVDQDLVLWITMGTHHIPHTEDLPVTPTVGGHLAFFLLPYNYFPQCPSVSSRDNVRVDRVGGNEGLRVDRSGNIQSQVCGAMTLEQLVKERPDDIIQTHRDFKLL